MLKMQGKVFKVDDIDIKERAYKLGGFWFEKTDISEDLDLKPPKPQESILFNPENIDTGEWKKENKI